MESIVPNTPNGLCFTRDKFIQNEFSADSFLQDLRYSVPLEVLRDDLGAYLKVLRSAMIELINRDYADFVNLSGNLVGLDKAIAGLQDPLSVIHTEILGVESVLKDAYSKLQNTLNERQSLREKSSILESLMKIPQCLNHLEKLLVNINKEAVNKFSEDDPSKGNMMERAANEFNQLQHLVVKCDNTSMVNQLKERIDGANLRLMKCLEDALLYGIEQQSNQVLKKTLRTFALLDQCQSAENLVKGQIIHPFVDSVLNENSLKKEPRDLGGLLSQLKDFIRQKMKELIDISISFEGAKGFNFVRNCIWPEFYHSLSKNLKSIFAQGNPDLLHKRFLCTMEFLEYLERMSTSVSLSHTLLADPNYQLLISQWNLPVYFQMRFQEIAGNFETSMMKPLTEFTGEKSSNDLKLVSSLALLEALSSCYAPDIYLSLLGHRFWKLNLQILARYRNKMNDIIQEQIKRCEISSSTTLTPSSSSSRLMDLDTPSAAGSTLPHSASTSRLPNVNGFSLQQWVHLDSDIRIILEKLPTVWSTAWNHLEKLGAEHKNLFENAYQAGVKNVEELLPKISKLIISELSLQCFVHLRSVGDIPRIYRRTNKEAPTKCCNYVNQLITPLKDFHAQQISKNSMAEQWTYGVLKSLSKQYLVVVSDVLTSVQKTEESLKRLRKGRSAATSSGITDDDKIRMQLIMDVDSYIQQVQTLIPDSLPEFQALLDVIEPARTVFRRSPAMNDT